MEMTPQLLTECDQTLSKCGRTIQPDGTSVLYIKRDIPIFSLAAAVGLTVVEKEIVGDAPWVIRAISSIATPNFQIEMPDGQFLYNQIAVPLYQPYALPEELECAPGSKIRITGTGRLRLKLYGAYKYTFKGGLGPIHRTTEDLASGLPRYVSHPNQNILAPCWRMGSGPRTPEGFKDEEFIGGNGVPLVIDTVNGPFQGTLQIPIEPPWDFIVRRVLFNVVADAGASGTFLVKVRAGSGYALMDDYIDVVNHLAGDTWAHDWPVKANDQIYFDIQLVDIGAGSQGNMTLYCYADGVRRRKL